MSVRLDLTAGNLLAKGNDRYVYQHPEDDNLIIKVVIPNIEKYRSKVREVQREIKECVPKSELDKRYIQKIKGLVSTNMGLGEVIVKEKSADGTIAKTLYDIVLEGEFDTEKQLKLNELLGWFMTTKVLINSLHCKNIVYALDDDGVNHFKIIDGFGDKTFFQLSKLSSYILAKSKIKCLKRMLDQLNDISN